MLKSMVLLVRVAVVSPARSWLWPRERSRPRPHTAWLGGLEARREDTFPDAGQERLPCSPPLLDVG